MFIILNLFIFCVCLFPGTYAWPEGTYGLPMPNSGCPHANSFQWVSGSRTHQTVKGSYASEESHLAGITATVAHPTDKITQNFCMKEFVYSASQFQWGKGVYCIFKLNECPAGLAPGSVHWDDDVPFFSLEEPAQHKTGVLPDGEYGRDTTINYCCRSDGSATVPIDLPTDNEFYLLKMSTQCQQVNGMTVKEEYVQWAGDQGFDLDTGKHPLTSRTPSWLRLYYCFYSPKEVSHTWKYAAITIGSIIAAVIAIGVLMFIIRHCIAWRCNKDETPIQSPETSEEVGSSPLVRGKCDPPLPGPYTAGHMLPSAPPYHDIDEPMILRNARPDSMPPSYEEALSHKNV